MDVVQGGAPAPAINIVCPHYLHGAPAHGEQHIIYSVQVISFEVGFKMQLLEETSQLEEFLSCSINRPRPRIIAKCTEPTQKK